MKIYHRIACVALAAILTASSLPISANLTAEREALNFQGTARKNLETVRLLWRKESATAEDCLDAAVVLEEMGYLKESIQALQQGIDKHPDDARLFSAMGWAKFHNGDLAEARNAFIKTLELGSKDDMDLLGLARLSMEEKAFCGRL